MKDKNFRKNYGWAMLHFVLIVPISNLYSKRIPEYSVLILISSENGMF
jgi:hypothetical protein